MLWKLYKTTNNFRCIQVSAIDPGAIPDFESASYKQIENKNGRFISQAIPAFPVITLADAPADESFPRRSEVAKNNIHGGIVFPIYEGSEILGMIELFQPKPLIEQIDQPLINLLASISFEIGQYINRVDAEQANRKIAALVTYSNEGIFSITLEGIITSSNPGAEKIFGYKAQEIIGEHVNKLYLPNNPEVKKEEFNQIIAKVLKGLSFEVQKERVRKDGKHIWVEYSIATIRDDQGNIHIASVMARDITEKKNLLTALQKSEEKFRAFIETTEEWIWEIDNKCSITYFNPTIEKILGYPSKNMIGI